MIFETVAKMKLAKLTAGQIISTKGYSVAGDGGGASYLVAASQTVDGYGDHALAGGTVALLQAGALTDVSHYGAKGDGVADDTAAIQSALNNSAVLHIPDSQYKVSSLLNITSSIEIRMDKETVIDGTSIPASVSLGDSPILNCRGSINTADLLTASALEGTSDFTVASAASYSIGDTVLVRSNAYYSTGVTTGSNKQGWITRIQNIVANTITLDVKAYAPLLTGDSASIAKINPISIDISGGKILGNGVGYGHSGIKLAYSVNSKIENVLVDGCEDVGIELGYTINSNVVNADISNCTSSATLGNTGYGVVFANGAEGCSVTESRFKNCRHSVSGGGIIPARYITVDNNVLTDGGRGTNDLDCHEPCFYWTISNNRIVNGEGTSGGMVVRGKDVKVIGNTIVCKDKSNVGIKVTSFIADTNKQTNIYIANNTIEGCSAGIILDTTLTLIEGVTIEGNTITNSSYNAIFVTDTKKLKIDNNRIDGTSDNAGTSGSLIRLVATTLGDIADVSICGNILTNGIQGLVRFGSVKGITINSNSMSNSSDTEGCIYVDAASEDIVACSNEFKDAYGFIQGPVLNAVISNNKGLINQPSGTTDFVRLYTSGGTSVINGNIVTGAYRKGVYVTDHERCIVTSNVFIDAENGTPIDFGTAVVTVNANNLI